MKRVITRLLMPVMLCTALAASVAPRPLAAVDSLCVRFSGTVAGERVGLVRGYTLGGVLPATICNLEPGTRYRLTLSGEGLERRIGAFSVGVGGAGAVHGVQFSVLSRNVILPGWGSAYAHRGVAGVTDFLGLAASLGMLYNEEMQYRDLRARFDELTESLAQATTDEERQRLHTAAYEASREVNIQNTYRRRLAMVAGAIYAWQVVEPFLIDNPPGSTAGQGGSVITLRGTAKSRAKAVLYSLLRPGRGQLYQGKASRGALFSIATFGAGLAALHSQNSYDVAFDDYEVCVERVDATDVVSEKEILRDEASRLFTLAERRRDSRNASLIVLAGIWSWNLVDAFLPGGSQGSVARRYSIDVDARGASIAYRF